jgi:hypothetical protein
VSNLARYVAYPSWNSRPSDSRTVVVLHAFNRRERYSLRAAAAQMLREMHRGNETIGRIAGHSAACGGPNFSLLRLQQRDFRTNLGPPQPFEVYEEAQVQYKGIEYSVVEASRPGVWKWQFQIGNEIRSGQTATKLFLMAHRRAQLKINQALATRLRGTARA